MSSDLIVTFEIPEYLKQVQMSKKRRKKYYKMGKKRKSNKRIWKPRQLPTTYQEKLDSGEWTMDKKGYLRDENGDKVLANPQAAGTPKYRSLSGNEFYSGYGSHHIRAKLARALKQFYRKHVKNLSPIDRFPLRIEWDMYTDIDIPNFDMDNFSFYWKYLQDTLVDEGVIPDDSVLYITHPPAPKLIPVDKEEDRKFVFRIYHDNRKAITKYYDKRNFKTGGSAS